jgi:hypothetical protein
VSATRAFDLALFVGTPANVNDASVVNAVGPPFTTAFKSVALSSKPGGVVVSADIPAAVAQNQILISGPGPNYAWALGTNPAAAASVPPPGAQFNVLVADATPSWQNSTPAAIVTLGHGVSTDTGGTFVSTANLVFTPTGTLAKRIDGGDPAFSSLDNFTLDSGTF